MAKVSKTHRLPQETLDKIEVLAKFFKESHSEVLERAVNLLDREKEREIQFEYEQRMSQVKPRE